MVRLGIESRASCSASKNLTTTPSLFQSALQHNSLSVNHACQVSGFWGESLDLLKMTIDDGFGNYHKQSLLLIKDQNEGFINLFIVIKIDLYDENMKQIGSL